MTDTPSEANHYNDLKAALLGRELSVEYGEDEWPMLADAVLKEFAAVKKLLADPDFSLFFAFMRKKSEMVLADAKSHPSLATESQLRWAVATRKVIEDMAEAAVNFVRDTENALLNRQKWLAEKDKPNNNQGASL